eukprot:2558727-Rhodomonas_salina.1
MFHHLFWYQQHTSNCRRLEDSAKTVGVDISGNEVTCNLPGIRGQTTKLWAASALAPGGWYTFKELQQDPSSM